MKSSVFFSDLKVESGKTLLDKLDILLDRVDLKGKIREKDLVAIKLSDLSFQVNTVQKDIQFIQEGFSRFNLQIRKKDRTLHFRTSLPKILRKSIFCVNGRRRRHVLPNSLKLNHTF